ncbi:MAG: sigma-70 family RNA polymerase sigma factor [Planctomycetota bacterium]|jgi:RNA polymerase sigma factor (TIGR02999 family)
MASRDEFTHILGQLSEGDESAVDRLLPLVYEPLRALAQEYLKQERREHTLQATALVHEVYLKLVGQNEAKWLNRAHFFAVSAQAIRRILVDHARYKRREKRGSGEPVLRLEEATLIAPDRQWDLVELDEALSRLAEHDERRAKVVEMRFFAGLQVEEIAAILNVSDRTVRNDWAFARAWLYRELTRSTNETTDDKA